MTSSQKIGALYRDLAPEILQTVRWFSCQDDPDKSIAGLPLAMSVQNCPAHRGAVLTAAQSLHLPFVEENIMPNVNPPFQISPSTQRR